MPSIAQKRRNQENYERGMKYCLGCGQPFKAGYERTSLCVDCKKADTDNVTVYDRATGVGVIPENLRKQYGL